MSAVNSPTGRGLSGWALAVGAAVLGACAVLPREIPREAPEAAEAPASAAAAASAEAATRAADGTSHRLARFARDRLALDALPTDASTAGDRARAQCLLQHAYSEWHENDRSDFIDAALAEVEATTRAVERGAAAPATALAEVRDLCGRAAVHHLCG